MGVTCVNAPDGVAGTGIHVGVDVRPFEIATSMAPGTNGVADSSSVTAAVLVICAPALIRTVGPCGGTESMTMDADAMAGVAALPATSTTCTHTVCWPSP